jgi:hypothetical protein
MMAVVAVAAVLLFLHQCVSALLSDLDDVFNEPFGAIRKETKSWDLGPSPSITVDVFEGSILVVPSPDGKVNAEITSGVLAEDSRSAAHEALQTIDVQIDQRGDTLRISARGASGPHPGSSWVRKDVRVDLYVPPGVRLDLRTGRGDIQVGRSFDGSNPIHRPIATASIRARNDSLYRGGYAEGNIIIETTPLPSSPDESPTTKLQLDATGQIEILAQNAVVEARAWHGTLPKGWTQASYEDGFEGSILFEGTLAEGPHSIRAAHRIEMKLPAETAYQIEAEAIGGAIQGDLLPKPVEARDGRATWKGSIGFKPCVNLRLRADEGPITLRTRP